MTSTLHWLDGPMAVPKITDRAKVVRMEPRTKSLTRACSRQSVMDRSAGQQDGTHVLGRHRTGSNCTSDCNLLAWQAPLPSGPVMAQEAEVPRPRRVTHKINSASVNGQAPRALAPENVRRKREHGHW
jgi:hypothetical protein